MIIFFYSSEVLVVIGFIVLLLMGGLWEAGIIQMLFTIFDIAVVVVCVLVLFAGIAGFISNKDEIANRMASVVMIIISGLILFIIAKGEFRKIVNRQVVDYKYDKNFSVSTIPEYEYNFLPLVSMSKNMSYNASNNSMRSSMGKSSVKRYLNGSFDELSMVICSTDPTDIKRVKVYADNTLITGVLEKEYTNGVFGNNKVQYRYNIRKCDYLTIKYVGSDSIEIKDVFVYKSEIDE